MTGSSATRKKRAKTGNRNRAQGDFEEKSIGHLTGMRRRRGSGSGPIEREDLIGRTYLGQVKSTSKESIGIKLGDLDKLVLHADEENVDPIMFVSFLTRRASAAPKRWALLPLMDWLELTGRNP